MKPQAISLLLSILIWASWHGGHVRAAEEQDWVQATKQATEQLTAADNVLNRAQAALAAARRDLDTAQFNSAAYNARVTAEQVAAAKKRYETAAAEQKSDALEVYELAQELAARRKAALEAAEKLLPQREAEARAAEEKYAAALAAAESAGSRLLALVRESEGEVAAKQKEAKLALERAAVAQATAEQTAAANAQVAKALAALTAAEAALQQATAAAESAAETDQAKTMAETQNAIKGYASALHAALPHLRLWDADPTETLFLELRIPLIDAEQEFQAAQTALQQATEDLQSRTRAVQQAEQRVKSAQDGVRNRIAKIAAQKELAREQEAAKRAEEARREAEQALETRKADAAKAQQAYAAVLQSAATALMKSPQLRTAERELITAAIAAKEAAIQKESQALASQAAEARAAADKASAELAAADKLWVARVGAREALDTIRRRRFYREAGGVQDELRRSETALAAANRELQTRLVTLQRATASHRAASEALSKAREAAAVQATAVAKATEKWESAEKLLGEKLAARSTAEREAREAQTAVAAARESLAKLAEDNRSAAEEQFQQQEAGARTAAERLKEAEAAANLARTAVEKSQAELKGARGKADELAQAIQAAERAAAAAQAALEKATADKAASEELVVARQAAVAAAETSLAVAKAAAYGGLKPLDVAAWDLAKARHLMVRAGFGGTPDEVAALYAMGLHRAVRHLLDFTKRPPADIPFAAHPSPQPESYESSLSGEERRRLRLERVAWDRQQMANMRQWWLRRMIESPRPLEEKLTLFWHGQIPVQYSDVGDSYYMFLQNQLFREHAAGSYSALLYGIAHDAAMLKYLNNDTNIKGRANENLAREIIELFSMGRDQGYTELDIRQGARALTGYTYDAATGQFRFVSDRHDTEPKTIFGKTGNWSGDDYVRLILDTPYPAKYIARQMFTFFAHDAPSLDTVESLASVLRLNQYNLAPMLENLFLSEEFYSAPSMSTQIKSPVQLIVGLHRDLGLKNTDYAFLATACRDMGQDLFEPPSVFGWQPGRSWVTTSRILSRYNAVAELLERRPRDGKTGVDVVGTLLAGKTFQNHGEVVDYLVKCCWMVPITKAKRQALIEYLKPLPEPAKWGADPRAANTRLTHLLVMLMCSPEYQLG